MSSTRYLLDVNVLVALTNEQHIHYSTARRWFDAQAREWGICAFSEAGLLRLSCHPLIGKLPVCEVFDLLTALSSYPGFRYWPIATDWATLVAPFRDRVIGHQQITDSYLLGLAIRENGILVTLDKAILYLAGPAFRHHVLVLE